MLTKRIYRIWVVSVSIGACIVLTTSIAAYVSKSFMGFIIGVILSYGLYCIIFHCLCLLFVPNINTFIIEEKTEIEGTTTTFITHFRRTEDSELNKYIDKYMEARLLSKSALGCLAVIAALIVIVLLVNLF